MENNGFKNDEDPSTPSTETTDSLGGRENHGFDENSEDDKLSTPESNVDKETDSADISDLPIDFNKKSEDAANEYVNDINSIPPLLENNEKSISMETNLVPEDQATFQKPVTMWSNEMNKLPSGSVSKDPELGESDEESRDVWASPVEFLLSCISMSVGLGNVWRFPFAAYSNGGGAFLIPYLIVLLLIGRPIYFMEMCLGQFSNYGPVKIWNMAPMFKGVGFGSMIGVIAVTSYYCSIMAQTAFYFFASFASKLPWSYCNKDWGGDLCLDDGTVDTTLSNKTTATLYYELEAFPRYDQIDDGLGNPEWRLTLCLLLSWIVIFLSLVKGVKSSGKVAYFTAIFPYTVLLILLIRGVTLPGAWTGIKYFITPQWEKIYEPKVWYAAVGQCFFSLGTGFGSIVMFSSYNPFRHNIYKDALIISVMDTFTSLLAGCTIFAVLGYLSVESGLDIKDVTEGGAGLAFVSYPEAIAQFAWAPQLFAVLFFLMLFTLGIGTATSLTGGIITIICDQFPKWVRWLVTLVVCFVGLLFSLMYVTPGGPFMVDLIDHFGANFVIYVMAMVEVGAISWVYGLGNFCNDIEFMLGIKVGWYWKFCWGFFIPVGLFGILVYTMVTEGEFKYGEVSYPPIAIVCGWLLAAIAVAMLPVWGLHGILSRKSSTFIEKFHEALRPTKHWGPKSSKLRAEWEEFKKNK